MIATSHKYNAAPTWWNCPLCKCKIQDDGDVASARRMGQHIAEHEEPEQKERAFQQWRAAGYPGMLSKSSPPLEADMRLAFDALLKLRRYQETGEWD